MSILQYKNHVTDGLDHGKMNQALKEPSLPKQKPSHHKYFQKKMNFQQNFFFKNPIPFWFFYSIYQNIDKCLLGLNSGKALLVILWLKYELQ